MDKNTSLYRQVHPKFIRNGKITSSVFKPTKKDNNLLSVYDGDKITPKKSWQHYTVSMEFKSSGVMAVTVAECNALTLPTSSDPTPFPEHAIIDFTKLNNSTIERKARQLKNAAIARDWLFQA